MICSLAATAAPAARDRETPRPQEIAYGALYARGVTFAAFLEKGRARQDEWRARYNDAAVTADMVTRMHALPERRRLLVVAEDWCSDSLNTVPYLARLVDAAPERLALRIVNSTAGYQIMEAHRTPDGRAATPTVVVLGEDDRLIGAWTERPAALRAWLEEQKHSGEKTLSRDALHDRAMKWYAEDAGNATVTEVAAILAR
jgi:hypothetical protein